MLRRRETALSRHFALEKVNLPGEHGVFGAMASTGEK
jgi:hypothetical protein